MVIKGSDRSHDFKTRERKASEVRSAPHAAARKAIRDKLEKQARDTAYNNYVNQPQEQTAPEAYGTEQVEALAQKAGDTTYATMKTASPKREAALRFKRREQTRKTAEQVQLRSRVFAGEDSGDCQGHRARCYLRDKEHELDACHSYNRRRALSRRCRGSLWLPDWHCHWRWSRWHAYGHGASAADGQGAIRPDFLHHGRCRRGG